MNHINIVFINIIIDIVYIIINIICYRKRPVDPSNNNVF